MTEEKTKKIVRKFSGIVVSTKMDKTIVVKVQRTKIHSKYGKRFKIHRKYLVDDSKGQYRVGDKVTFQECRPLSKSKRWRVIYENKSNE